MKYKRLQTVLSLFLIAAAIVCAIPVNAAGKNYTASIPISVSNPNNNIPKDTELVVTITAKGHAPLPVPAKLKVSANGSYEFPEIVFTEPGNYYYSVAMDTPDDEKVIHDTKVFNVKITVIRSKNGDLQGSITLPAELGSLKPTSITFENDYVRDENQDSDPSSETDPAESDEKPDNPGEDDKPGDDDDPKEETASDTSSESETLTPKTGEPLSPAFGGLMLSGALFVLFIIIRLYRRKADTAQRGDTLR